MIVQLIRLIRYRFFLFAGVIPYILGQVIAFNTHRFLDWHKSLLGFLGIVFALIGVELFNEYFDAQGGGDRIFSQEAHKIPRYFYALGILVFAAASLIGAYLAFKTGWLVVVFSLLGFLAAYFYVGPPLKWAYHGWGEVVIAFSYGPFMLLGSYYLQTQRIDALPVFVSVICALTMFCLAIVNEIPDYYQDKVAGKRNLVVKFGKPNAIRLVIINLSCIFFLLWLGMALKKIPLSAMVVFLTVPRAFKSLNAARKDYDNPKVFLLAINTNIIIYLTIALSLAVGYITTKPALY